MTYLSVDGAKLVPGFSPDVKSYTATLTSSTAKSIPLVVEPTSTRSRSITVDGTPVKSGIAHQVALTGNETAIRIQVESPDGSRSADYVVSVRR